MNILFALCISVGMGQVGNCSSHEPTESLTVELGRVILRFELRANRVENRVKIEPR